MHEHDNPSLFTIQFFAREMRRNPTCSERLLWRHLCRKQLGVRVRRQHVLYPYVVDFYVPSFRLVVEVDGGVHDSDAAHARDTARASALVQVYSVRVLRIDAALVETHEGAQTRAGWFAQRYERNVFHFSSGNVTSCDPVPVIRIESSSIRTPTRVRTFLRSENA